MSISSNHSPLPVFQVDTLEVIRHPEETTNMKGQTMASYFRVWSLLDLYSACFQKGLANPSHKRPRYHRVTEIRAKLKSQLRKVVVYRERKIITGNLPLRTVFSDLRKTR